MADNNRRTQNLTGIHLLFAALALALLLAIASACGGTIRYVPAASPGGAVEAQTQACLAECEESWRDWYYTHGLGGQDRAECISQCPGIVAEQGACTELPRDRTPQYCEDTR